MFERHAGVIAGALSGGRSDLANPLAFDSSIFRKGGF
jgi:hypothetical protein